jgi:alkylation response protein AidB-like acyl-CoA dehydrogenase
MEIKGSLRVARLCAWRTSWVVDQGVRNNLEASMARAKAGLAVTPITQKGVELVSPLGYSRKCLLGK